MIILDLYGLVTPKRMIEVKYEKAKNICLNIWDKPNKYFFEDIFHDTIYKCLITLENKKFDQDYLKSYFFKSFRINMVRFYGYSYNKLNSGLEIENSLIPVINNYDEHLDGFGMLDYVKQNYGDESRNMLWDNLTGYTYKELDKIYNTNSFYQLNKIKNDLKSFYKVKNNLIIEGNLL